MRTSAAALLLLALAGRAEAEPLAVSADPIPSFARLSAEEEFGPLLWRGGMTLSADSEDFGGFSGLMLGGNCEDLLAVNDRGHWLRGRLAYADGRLAGISGVEMAPILDQKGQPPRSKAWADAEAVARLADGHVAVAFERRVRIGLYDVDGQGLAARFVPVPSPKEMALGPENGEVESLGELPDGRLIAVAERQYDERGDPLAWTWRGGEVTRFSLERYDDYKVTDLAVLPDGTVLTLERRLSSSSLPGMAVRRFSSAAIRNGDVVEPELLFEATAPLYIIDNMEGMALCQRDGEMRLTFVSDDNFNGPIQSTILLQFAYRP